MKISTLPFSLKFKRPFTLAHGVRTGTELAFVKIEQDGVVAYGEASLPPYREETLSSVEKWVDSKHDEVVEILNSSPFERRDEIPFSEEHTAASNALQTAMINWHVKHKGERLSDHFSPKDNDPYLSLTFTKDDIPILDEKLKLAQHFTHLKLKLTGDQDDFDFVEAVMKQSEQPICVDFNQAFRDREKAIASISELEKLSCTLIEQPLHEKDHEGHYWIKQRTAVPIIADESICTYADLKENHEAYSGVNIKLVKCGGIFQAEKLLGFDAGGNYMKLVGCMSESTLGVSTAALIAHQGQIADLDAPYLNSNDPFTGFEIKNKKIHLGELCVSPLSPLR
ncbi:MAG: hypothetical protein HKN92_09895 [Chitinophagales bacterium]|nr:hypothetical protein [Chitinophagales bacterium]